MPASRLPLNRVLAIAVSAASIAAAIAVLALSWAAPMELLPRLVAATSVVFVLLVLGIALLIAWRAGDHPPNVAMALALAFVFGADAFGVLMEKLHVDATVARVASFVLFFFGAAFYIRASQLFPRALTAADIASSPTLWGKLRPLRIAVTFLLRAPAVWGLAALAAVLAASFESLHALNAVQIFVVLTGVVYFYITYRGADAEAKRKVLWFFEATLATLAILVIVVALRAALLGSDSPTLRDVLQLIVNVVSGLATVVCFAAAVFYAGAVSPALIVRKTLVYAATVAVLLFLFAAVEIFIVESLVHALHVTDRFASALLGATFGLGFHPLKHRIEHLLRRFAPKVS